MSPRESSEGNYEDLQSNEPQPEVLASLPQQERADMSDDLANSIDTNDAVSEVPDFVTDIAFDKDILRLKVAGVQRSFRMRPEYNKENGIRGMLEHLYKIGRYTPSEHGSKENFDKSQAALAAYLNPPKTEVAAESKSDLEIPPEFETTGLAQVLRETGFNGQFKIERMPGNGNRPVVVLIPKGFDPNKPAKLLVHFHGTHSDKIAAKNFIAKKADHSDTAKNRFTQFVEQAMTAKENVVFAYPISAGKARAAKGKDYDGNWMAPGTSDNFDGLVANIKSKVGFTTEPKLVISGHSAGGKPLKNIALSHAKTKADYIFLDASYGTGDNWAKAVTDGMERNDIPIGKVTIFLQENPSVETSAYVHTTPLIAALEKQGATVKIDKTKHAVMIATHLLDGVSRTENGETMIASR